MSAKRLGRLLTMACTVALGVVWVVWMAQMARPDDRSLCGLAGAVSMGAAIGYVLFRDLEGVRRAVLRGGRCPFDR